MTKSSFLRSDTREIERNMSIKECNLGHNTGIVIADHIRSKTAVSCVEYGKERVTNCVNLINVYKNIGGSEVENVNLSV